MKISVDEKTWHDPRFVHVCKLLGWEEQTVLGALIMIKCRVYGNNVEMARQPIEVLSGLGKHAQRFVDALLEAGLLFELPTGKCVLDGAQRAMTLSKARAEAGRRGGKRKPAPKTTAPEKKTAPKKKQGDDTFLKLKAAAAWGAYASAYMQRYGTPPVRNEKINGQVKNLVKRVGEEAEPLLRWFVLKHEDEWYVRRTHQVGDCLRDAESLVTQMRADKPQTRSTVRRETHQSELQAQIAGVRSGALLR